MNFYNWMMKNYKNAESPAGDLARDMYEDDHKENFKNSNPGKYKFWNNHIRAYLESCHACDDCIETFEKCWREYEYSERKKLGHSLKGFEDLERPWAKTYEYRRILEILDDYWLTEPDEKVVRIKMSFLKANGEFQSKLITWCNPRMECTNDDINFVDNPTKDLASLLAKYGCDEVTDEDSI